MFKLDVLVELIAQWGADRGIVQNAKPMGQAIKTLEETTELLDALNKGDKQALKDAVGDVFVTLVMVCETSGITMEESVNLAYDEIKDRKGFLGADGVFVKD
jgi:NTP pyrophosphatase (non-canonical NTP hydrolase)